MNMLTVIASRYSVQHVVLFIVGAVLLGISVWLNIDDQIKEKISDREEFEFTAATVCIGLLGVMCILGSINFYPVK